MRNVEKNQIFSISSFQNFIKWIYNQVPLYNNHSTIFPEIKLQTHWCTRILLLYPKYRGRNDFQTILQA